MSTALPAPRGATTTPVWIDALNVSSRRLRQLVRALSAEELCRRSQAGHWTVAQVLSHLGSAAEISTALLERGIAGDTRGPVRGETLPVWERWDTLSPEEQRNAWLEADGRHLGLIDSLDSEQRENVRVPYFAGLLDIGTYAGYRLSEQALHAWDVEAAFDTSATVPADQTDLLWERIDLVASRFRSPELLSELAPRRLRVMLNDRDKPHLLDLGTELHLGPTDAAEPHGTLAGSAEAVLRLVYGRARDRDDLRTTGPVTLTHLRQLFPGF